MCSPLGSAVNFYLSSSGDGEGWKFDASFKRSSSRYLLMIIKRPNFPFDHLDKVSRMRFSYVLQAPWRVVW